MIDVEAAREIVEHYVRNLGDDLAVSEEPIASGDYGWVFSYQSRAFIETNDIRDALAGNAPLLIESKNGLVFILGTAHDVDKYVQMYLRFGDPHAEPGPKLELLNWRKGANKVAATKEIKAHTPLGLKDAKRTIDDCLSGQKPLLRCSSTLEAEVLVRRLSSIGFEARQLAQ